MKHQDLRQAVKVRVTGIASESGISSLELLALVSLLTMVSLTALPFHTVLEAYSLETAAQTIYADLQSTRLEAVTRNQTMNVAFDTNKGTYTLDSGKEVGLPKGVQFTNVSRNPAFYSRGSAEPTTISISNPRGSKNIVITASGRIAIN